MGSGIRRYMCLGIGAWGVFTAAQAADTAAATDTNDRNLEQVVVTGHLEEDLPFDLEKYGTRVDIITAAQIRNGGFVDVAQALQSLTPGLYISPKNGPFDYADISLLGSRTQDVLWLVDGVRINNRLYGSTPPLDTLPAAMVERIEVLDGPQALFYGTQSSAGAINVITKSFSDTPDGGISLGADTNRGKHADGYFRDSFGSQHFVVFASDDQASGFRPFREQDYQPSSTDRERSYNLRTVGLKYAFDVTEALRLSATAQHTEGRVDDAAPAFVATSFNQRDEDIFSGKLDYTPNDQVQLFAKGYFHDWRSHFTEFDNDLETPGTLDVIDNHDFWGFKDSGANAAIKLDLNRGFEYYLGTDYQAYSGRDAVLVIAQKSEDVHAFFGQIATTPDLMPNVNLAAGFRYNDPSVGPSATVWNVSSKINLPAGLYVRAQAGTSFRLPTAEELFANDPEDERGNPDLKPERSRNFNLSLGGAVLDQHLKWEVSAFYRDITDLISFDGFDDATDQSLAENIPGTVHIRGAEFTLESAISTDLSATANYTYNHARQNGDQQIARVPLQQAKATLDFHPVSSPFGASIDLNYVGQAYQSVWDGFEKYGKYLVVDVAGRYYFDSARHHSITARLENAFDKQYASSLGSSERDSDGSNYTYWNLGVPRTFQLRYNFQF
ncbi:MAG TPA: TonB-dependent receptor [Steroidobacteraceae bacterium]